MRSTIVLLALGLFSSIGIASPLTTATSCTTTVYSQAPVETDCTFSKHTTTKTVHTNCGGCVLVTKKLGVGIACQTIHTVPGTATATVTACKTKARKDSMAPTASACTKNIFPTMGALSSSTCTFYNDFTTSTAYTDCGGCALHTVLEGPGPVVQCGATTTAALGTETVTACATS